MHTWASSHGLLTFTLCIWQEWPFCFSPINQRAPLKKKTHHPLNANTSVFRCSSGVCGTRVWFRAQRYRETGPCGQCQFPWFPSVKGRFSLGLACLWSPVKRWLCVLRSRAHCGQNSSVTPTELGLCSTADGRESGGGKHRSSMFGCLARRHASLRGSGDWVTAGGSKQASVCTFYTSKHRINCRDTVKARANIYTNNLKNTCMWYCSSHDLVAMCNLRIIITFAIQKSHIKTCIFCSVVYIWLTFWKSSWYSLSFVCTHRLGSSCLTWNNHNESPKSWTINHLQTDYTHITEIPEKYLKHLVPVKTCLFLPESLLWTSINLKYFRHQLFCGDSAT